MKKYYLDYIEIFNNQRLYEGMGITEIKIPIKGRRLVGIVGENGSGKSSLLTEFQPTANYSYMRDMVGRKNMIYKSYDTTEEIHINFLFEPVNTSVNGHNCKIYIKRLDYNTNQSYDLNQSGGFNSGMECIHKLLGYSDNVAPLFNISDSDMFFAERTAGSRFVMIQKIINGLEDIKFIASKYLDKNRAVNTSLKATQKKLENLGDKVILENTLTSYEARIKELEIEYNDISNKIANLNISQEVINIKESRLKIWNKQLKDVNDIVTFYLNNYDAKSEYTFMNDRAHMTAELKLIESRVTEYNQERMALESELSTLRLKDKVDVDFSEEEYNKCIEFFKDYSEEELKRVSMYSLEQIMNIKAMIDEMDRLIQKFRFDVYDYDEVISLMNNTDAIRERNMELIDSARELHHANEELEKKLIGSSYVKELSRSIDTLECKLSCTLKERVLAYDSDIMSIITAIDDNEETMKHLKAEFNRNETLSGLAVEYQKSRKFYYSMKDLFDKYFERFDFDTVMRNSQTNNLKIQIALRKTEYETYMKMMKLKDDKRYVDMVNGLEKDNIKKKYNRIEELKTISDTLTETYKIMKSKLANMENILVNIGIDNRGYDIIYILSKNLQGIRTEIEERKDSINKLISEIEIDKANLRLVNEGETVKEEKRKNIEKLREEINDIRDKLGGIKLLSSDNERLTWIAQEMNILTNTVSKKLLSKVVSSFMIDLKEIANKTLRTANLPYEVLQPIVSDTEFKIPILKTQSALTAIDISNTSKGERTITNMALTISCQDVIHIPYTTTCLDEVDAFFSQRRRAEFMSIINRCVVEEDKQIFCISHDYKHFTEPLGLIVLKDGTALEGAEILYDYRNNK